MRKENISLIRHTNIRNLHIKDWNKILKAQSQSVQYYNLNDHKTIWTFPSKISMSQLFHVDLNRLTWQFIIIMEVKRFLWNDINKKIEMSNIIIMKMIIKRHENTLLNQLKVFIKQQKILKANIIKLRICKTLGNRKHWSISILKIPIKILWVWENHHVSTNVISSKNST